MVAFGAFLYSLSSFLRREFASLRFALFMIVVISLWHRAEISFRCGGSASWRTSVACVRVCVVRVVSVEFGVLALGF